MYSNVAQLISFKLQFFVNWGYHSMVASWGPGGAKLDHTAFRGHKIAKVTMSQLS